MNICKSCGHERGVAGICFHYKCGCACNLHNTLLGCCADKACTDDTCMIRDRDAARAEAKRAWAARNAEMDAARRAENADDQAHAELRWCEAELALAERDCAALDRTASFAMSQCESLRNENEALLAALREALDGWEHLGARAGVFCAGDQYAINRLRKVLP